MNDVLIIIILIVVFLAAFLAIPNLMTRRAIGAVIKIFRKHNAIGIENARTIDELGLRPPSLMQRMMSRRDYKPRALEVLLRTGIVIITEDGKLYLSEKKLMDSGLEKR